MKKTSSAVSRSLALSLAVGVVVGAVVLLLVGLRGAAYEGRVGLIAGPAPKPAADAENASTAQFGEVVSLTLPALVELARSPSVLRTAAARVGSTPEEVGESVSVELVPASGLARLSVRASSADAAGNLATTIGTAMIDADLLAPVGKLRLLDANAEVTRVSPDWLLATGLAIAAAVAGGVAAALALRLRTPAEDAGVREALAAAGTDRAVAILRGDDPELVERLSVLGNAAERRLRVVAVDPGSSDRAASLSERLGAVELAPGAGAGIVALAPADGTRRAELAATVGVLPESAVLVAVVLT